MNIEEKKSGDILIEVIKRERATVEEANDLEKKLSEGIKKGFTKIIIDLSNCEYIDSTFLGVLVSSLKFVTRLNGDLRLAGLQPTVLAMFELTRMFRVFQSYSDVPKAVESFMK